MGDGFIGWDVGGGIIGKVIVGGIVGIVTAGDFRRTLGIVTTGDFRRKSGIVTTGDFRRKSGISSLGTVEVEDVAAKIGNNCRVTFVDRMCSGIPGSSGIGGIKNSDKGRGTRAEEQGPRNKGYPYERFIFTYFCKNTYANTIYRRIRIKTFEPPGQKLWFLRSDRNKWLL